MKYFAYNSYIDGFMFYATAQEAIDACNEIIEYFRDEAGEGWSEEVNNTCWGIVSQVATEFNSREVTEEDHVFCDCDHVCDYRLEDVKEPVNPFSLNKPEKEES